MSCSLKDRGPFKANLIVQEGWWMDGVSRTAKMVSIPFRMAADCQFQKDDKYSLADCIGCSHKETHAA